VYFTIETNASHIRLAAAATTAESGEEFLVASTDVLCSSSR